jgi:hypothetical protein
MMEHAPGIYSFVSSGSDGLKGTLIELTIFSGSPLDYGKPIGKMGIKFNHMLSNTD